MKWNRHDPWGGVHTPTPIQLPHGRDCSQCGYLIHGCEQFWTHDKVDGCFHTCCIEGTNHQPKCINNPCGSGCFYSGVSSEYCTCYTCCDHHSKTSMYFLNIACPGSDSDHCTAEPYDCDYHRGKT